MSTIQQPKLNNNTGMTRKDAVQQLKAMLSENIINQEQYDEIMDMARELTPEQMIEMANNMPTIEVVENNEEEVVNMLQDNNYTVTVQGEPADISALRDIMTQVITNYQVKNVFSFTNNTMKYQVNVFSPEDRTIINTILFYLAMDETNPVKDTVCPSLTITGQHIMSEEEQEIILASSYPRLSTEQELSKDMRTFYEYGIYEENLLEDIFVLTTNGQDKQLTIAYACNPDDINRVARDFRNRRKAEKVGKIAEKGVDMLCSTSEMVDAIMKPVAKRMTKSAVRGLGNLASTAIDCATVGAQEAIYTIEDVKNDVIKHGKEFQNIKRSWARIMNQDSKTTKTNRRY